MGKNLKNNIEIITNGYDEDDFLEIESIDNTKNSLVISYVGSMAKSQIPKSFFMAMCELKKKNIPIKIQFIGNVHPEAVLLIEKLEITDQIQKYCFSTLEISLLFRYPNSLLISFLLYRNHSHYSRIFSYPRLLIVVLHRH